MGGILDQNGPWSRLQNSAEDVETTMSVTRTAWVPLGPCKVKEFNRVRTWAPSLVWAFVSVDASLVGSIPWSAAVTLIATKALLESVFCASHTVGYPSQPSLCIILY